MNSPLSCLPSLCSTPNEDTFNAFFNVEEAADAGLSDSETAMMLVNWDSFKWAHELNLAQDWTALPELPLLRCVLART